MEVESALGWSAWADTCQDRPHVEVTQTTVGQTGASCSSRPGSGPIQPRLHPDRLCHQEKDTGESSLRSPRMSRVFWDTSLCPGALISMMVPDCPLVLIRIQ